MKSLSFIEIFQKGLQKKQKGHIEQAKKMFLQAEKKFKPNVDDYTDIISVYCELGQIQKNSQQFQSSRYYYQKGIKQLSKAIQRDQQEQAIQKQKFHIYTNFGLLQLLQAQSIIDKKINYEKFTKLIDQSFLHFNQSQKIVIKKIIKSQQKKWWKKEYIALILNMCNSLEVQCQQFNDKKINLKIVELVERAQKFYQLCKGKDSNKSDFTGLKQNLSKCYYSKAVSLRSLNNKKESDKYFKKDYDFCYQNNRKSDLQKTKHTMCTFYLNDCEFKLAIKYAQNSSYKQQIQQKQRQYNRIMKQVIEYELMASRDQLINIDQLGNILIDFNNLNLNQRCLKFNLQMRTSHMFKESKKYRYYLEYHITETYIKLQRYKEAKQSLAEAFQLLQYLDDKNYQEAWCYILNAKITINYQNNSKDAQKMLIHALQKGKQSTFQNLIQQAQKQLEKFKINQKRKYRQFNFDNTQTKKLFQYLEQQRKIKQKNRINEQKHKNSEQNEILLNQMQDFSNNLNHNPFQRQKQVRLIKKNPYILYIQQCKLLNIESNEKLKQILLSQQYKNFNINNLIYFESLQILAFISSLSKIQQLDLTNIIIDYEFIQKLRNVQSLLDINKFKINLINLQIVKHQTTNLNGLFQSFIKFLQRIICLQDLTLISCIKADHIQQVIRTNSLRSLTTLKLKQCELQDKNLVYLSLGQNFPNLKNLNLSNNKLQGRSLQCLSLLNLYSLNISGNLLTNLNIQSEFKTLKKVKISNINSKISKQNFIHFIPLLLNCQRIILKFNSNENCFGILQAYTDYIIDREIQNAHLRQLNLFGSSLNVHNLRTLISLNYNSKELQIIDLRSCNFVNTVQEDQNINYILNNFKTTIQSQNMHTKYPYQIQQQNPQQKSKQVKIQNIKILKNLQRRNKFKIY